jgi:hypothetical protein
VPHLPRLASLSRSGPSYVSSASWLARGNPDCWSSLESRWEAWS